MCSCYCEETQNSFKITKAEIDINQYCACKCNYFSHVKDIDRTLEICFSTPKTKDILQFLKVQSCKLHNNKYMIASIQITNTEIFAFIAVLVFELLSCKILFINRKDNRNC